MNSIMFQGPEYRLFRIFDPQVALMVVVAAVDSLADLMEGQHTSWKLPWGKACGPCGSISGGGGGSLVGPDGGIGSLLKAWEPMFWKSDRPVNSTNQTANRPSLWSNSLLILTFSKNWSKLLKIDQTIQFELNREPWFFYFSHFFLKKLNLKF